MQDIKFFIDPGKKIVVSCMYASGPSSIQFIPVDCSNMMLTMVVINSEEGADVYQYDLTNDGMLTFNFDETEIGISFIVYEENFLGFRFINCEDFDVFEEAITF
ncbi:MAG TPA: hypothetical protein VJ508_19940 [Saprospiraceae bacterium]|nr:hypothetical protein [Saprospiraceae bacterium]